MINQTIGNGAQIPFEGRGCAPKIKGLSLPESVLTQPFNGRVNTFYNLRSAMYSETYEPARPSRYGAIGRIESCLVGAFRRYVAYGPSGQRLSCPEENSSYFDQESLPLMFDPHKEQQFAEACLSIDASQDLFHYSNGVIIYRNADGQAIGIVRLKTSP